MSKGKKFDAWNGQSTLFSIWLGCNDIRCIKHDMYPDVTAAYDEILTILFDKIEGMYGVGARNFLILNIPSLDKFPLKADDNYSYYRYDVAYYNKKLEEQANEYFKKRPDTNIIVYNTKEQYNYTIMKYSEYGLLNADLPWVNKRTISLGKFFWYDNFHLSYRGHQIIAEDINDLLTSLNKS